MANIIYGVDIDSEFTALDARDAILRCFTEAHGDVLRETMFPGQTEIDPAKVEQLKQLDIRMLIKQMFAKVDGDFDCPTKASLYGVVGELRKFSESFRNQETIEMHAQTIRSLLERLPEDTTP